ncbi:MAG: ArnT family glycosyltransferase [Candidatus Binatia bacterium]
MRIRTPLRPLFSSNGTLSIPLVALFILVNLVVVYNASIHDPSVGYDSAEHIKYVEVIAQGRLPTPIENYEYFSPPLPYIVPALARVAGASTLASAKCFQFMNVVYSVAALLLLLSICRLCVPGSSLGLNAVLLLAVTPVYYKSFAMVRSDPLFMTLCLAATWSALKLARSLAGSNGGGSVGWAVASGVLVGCAMLTRQWAVFLILALLVLWGVGIAKRQLPLGRTTARVSLVMVIAFVISSWFFFHLNSEYGSFGAFNMRRAESFSLSNQPDSFYLGTGDGELFSEPLRPAFRNQLMPVLYSETWGDYWCYFQVRGTDKISGVHLAGAILTPPTPARVAHNRAAVAPILVRSNILGLLPTLLLLAGIAYGLTSSLAFLTNKTDPVCSASALLFFSLLFVLTGFLGYMWFLIMYPHPAEGDTIKATYILQLFPFLSILGGALMSRIEDHSKRAYYLICALLVLVLVLNLPVCVTRYGV